MIISNKSCFIGLYYHLVRLLRSTEILTSWLRWPEPSTRCRWAIWRTTSHRCSSLRRPTFKGSLTCLGCSAGIVILLLLLPFELILTTQASQSPVGTLETLICSNGGEHSTHSLIVASLSLSWTSDQGTSLRLNPNGITRIIPRKGAS